MIDFVFKCICIALTTILINIILKSFKNQFNSFVTLCASVIIIFITIFMLTPIIEFIGQITSNAIINNSYVSIVLKSIGIALICDYTVNVCKDFSENTIAYCTELAAKVCIITLSIPIYEDIINIITSLWKKH